MKSDHYNILNFFLDKVYIFSKQVSSLVLIPAVLSKFFTIIAKIKRNRKVLVINLTEHIGDIVACEPVGTYLRTNHKGSFIIWIVNKKYVDLVRYNPDIDLVIQVSCLSEWIYMKVFLKLIRIKIFDMHFNKRICTTYYLKNFNNKARYLTLDNYYDYGSLLETFSLAAGLPRLTLPPHFHFPKDFKFKEVLPESYIVIHCISNEMQIPGIILSGHYRAFQNYNPYTGFYNDNSQSTIIHYNGLVQDIPLDTVFKMISKNKFL